MRKLLLFTIMAVSVCFAYSQITFAACGGGPTVFTCDTADPNPDPTGVQQGLNPADVTINVLPGAGVDTRLANGGGGGNALDTSSGDDHVNVDNGDIAGEGDGIDTSSFADVVVINDSTVTGGGDGINTSSGPDMVTVNNSTVTGGAEGINTSSNIDIVTVDNSTVTGALNGIDTSSNMDTVTVTNSTVTGQNEAGIDTSSNKDQVTIINSIIIGQTAAIDTSSNTDTITLGTGADIRGVINCGVDFDTLIFTMEVPEEALLFISSEIAAADPAGDSITINGLFYEWENCELLVSQLVGVPNARPIPTLSEWGLIAMAGVLGLVGLLAVRRRRVTA